VVTRDVFPAAVRAAHGRGDDGPMSSSPVSWCGVRPPGARTTGAVLGMASLVAGVRPTGAGTTGKGTEPRKGAGDDGEWFAFNRRRLNVRPTGAGTTGRSPDGTKGLVTGRGDDRAIILAAEEGREGR
jgi:hypothetical protein